jgi:hypothetical protein
MGRKGEGEIKETRQKTEYRGPKTEDRKPRTEDPSSGKRKQYPKLFSFYQDKAFRLL